MDNLDLYYFTHLAGGSGGATDSNNVKSQTIAIIWSGTQAQYNALSSYSNSTLYVISG